MFLWQLQFWRTGAQKERTSDSIQRNASSNWTLLNIRHKTDHLSSSYFYRDLYCTNRGPIPDFRPASCEAGWACGSRPVSVQPQRPEASELSGARGRPTPGLGERRLQLRRVGVLQCDPASQERGPRGSGENGRPAGHHRGQGDPLHLQRHLPVCTTSQQIAGAHMDTESKDYAVPG